MSRGETLEYSMPLKTNYQAICISSIWKNKQLPLFWKYDFIGFWFYCCWTLGFWFAFQVHGSRTKDSLLLTLGFWVLLLATDQWCWSLNQWCSIPAIAYRFLMYFYLEDKLVVWLIVSKPSMTLRLNYYFGKHLGENFFGQGFYLVPFSVSFVWADGWNHWWNFLIIV